MVLGILNKINLGKKKVMAVSPKTLKINNFMTTDKTIVAGEENFIGSFTIEPQTEHAFGYGTPVYSDNQGTIYVNLKDSTGAELDGEIILSVQDYQGNEGKVVFRGELSDLRSGETDITKRIKFPLQPVFGKENDRLVLKFVPSDVGNGTLSASNSKALIASSVRYTGSIE